MQRRTIGVMMTMILGLLAGTVSAQDDPKVGVTMGYPASVGVIWQATDRVALRPEITFTRASGETTSTNTATTFSSSGGLVTTSTTSVNTTDTWQAGTGLSALFYLTRHDALRTYVSPRWAYGRTSSRSSTSTAAILFGSDTSQHSVVGSFGAQIIVGRRFGIYGEAGVGFVRTVSTPVSPSAIVSTVGPSISRSLGTRGGAGVALYF